MVKIRLAIIFIIAQVVLTKYTSSRFRSRIVEDRAIRYNRNIEANCLSNTVLGRLKDLKEVSYALNTQLTKFRAFPQWHARKMTSHVDPGTKIMHDTVVGFVRPA